MEFGAKELIGLGLGGPLLVAILWYLRLLVTKTLPEAHAAHVAALERSHARCEESLTKVTDEFHKSMQRERADSLAVAGKMIDRIESLENSVVTFMKENLK